MRPSSPQEDGERLRISFRYISVYELRPVYSERHSGIRLYGDRLGQRYGEGRLSHGSDEMK